MNNLLTFLTIVSLIACFTFATIWVCGGPISAFSLSLSVVAGFFGVIALEIQDNYNYIRYKKPVLLSKKF